MIDRTVNVFHVSYRQEVGGNFWSCVSHPCCDKGTEARRKQGEDSVVGNRAIDAGAISSPGGRSSIHTSTQPTFSIWAALAKMVVMSRRLQSLTGGRVYMVHKPALRPTILACLCDD